MAGKTDTTDDMALRMDFTRSSHCSYWGKASGRDSHPGKRQENGTWAALAHANGERSAACAWWRSPP